MINHVVLVGRLARDPELRKTPSGLSTVRFTVACDRRQSANSQERKADFITCVAWRNTADFVGQYVRKGAMVGVEGRIQTGSYQRPDGTTVYTTDVLCDSVQLLESKATSEQRRQQESNQGYQQGGYQAQPSYNDYQANRPAYDDYDSTPTLNVSSDDLPF